LSGSDSDLIARIRMEYAEMPGLALTRAQATRLWHLDAGVCERVLKHLVREKFLAELAGGRFLHLGCAPAAR
jgi:hypothetical protein